MTNVFVSGWCGFSSIFGDFADKFGYFVPFYDEIDSVFDKKGKNLVCWSTGANLALKQPILDFENIILVSPFVRFTDYTSERVLKRMIKKFETEPAQVIQDFMTACGVGKFSIPADVDYAKLMSGLEYLRDSGEDIRLKGTNIKILHGEDDAVVSIKAGREIAELLGCELVTVKNCGHFVHPEIIEDYLI